MTLVWDPSSSLTGQLSRYKALSTEQYSSLLEPSSEKLKMAGDGATAIVSASSSSAPSVHISLVFNGLFLPQDLSDVPIVVQLEHLEKNYVILREEIIVKKPSNLNFGEVRSAISSTDLRLLTRGKLSISMMSRKDPQALKLMGAVTPRVTCEMYQTMMFPDTSAPIAPGATGVAWAFLDRHGALRYGFQFNDLDDENPLVTFVDESGKRRMELEDLTSSLVKGAGNGTVERPGPKILEPLFNGDLALIAASHSGSILRGRLSQRSITDAKDTAAPVLLRNPDRDNSTVIQTGLIWASIDPDCALHYEVELNGFSPLPIGNDESRTLGLYLETMPLLMQGAPVYRRLLEEFSGSTLEGSFAGLSSIELYRIESGIGFLEVSDKESGKLLKAPFKARAPLSCLPHYADNDVASVVAYNLQPPQEMESTSCYHEGEFHEEGTQWTSVKDPCSMCHCYRGMAQCDPVPCPVLKCLPGKEVMQAPGHCCPICASELGVWGNCI